ncbi:MAG: tRNA adenosine(34) deaminase TadA [candidate division WOR-3 bacterium]|nr:tRNA adenosine(34) deaminase TadA [candidate division WOR-3 bacterium]MCX7757274.1 tRNA adenosine(34) deaminase TadA [candidate division WOR-3 bacterium]MDW7987995.1 tRNA adenosine(34) deaminase TadA [candidate division WOR-3 bacterium]
MRRFTDEYWMRFALAEAQKAFEEDEVPVGAVVISDNKIIGQGHNQIEKLRDPTAHAEIIALTAASNYLNSWRLNNATMYVTLEPCIMCTGALILARIKKLVFGAFDPKFGACGSVYNIPMDNKLNHKFEVKTGVLAEESKLLLREFFEKKRKKNNR